MNIKRIWSKPVQSTETDYHNRCSTCLLPETFPNTTFNEYHVCNHCIEYQNKQVGSALKKDLKKRESSKNKLIQLLEKTRNTNKSQCDCLVSYSGGKDSTYLLYLLKE